MKKGFTLTELLVTIVLLAVLASIAVPGFSRSRDKAAANQAIDFLRVIRTAQDIHFSKNGDYGCQGGAGDTCTDRGSIRTALGAEISEGLYNFTVTGGATTFSATAVRGTCTIGITQTGNFTATAGCSPYVDAARIAILNS
jgi:type IV pilus assembly protein PilE